MRHPTVLGFADSRRARLIPTIAALAVAGLALPIAVAPSAVGATVFEVEAEWEEATPSQVSTGDSVSATWWFNVNDDAPAPSNDPVDDVALSVMADGATFTEIPEMCLTGAGLVPESEISADGSVLTCNTGTQDQGTAIVLRTPLVVTASSGETVSASGSIGGQTAEVPELSVVNDFSMDMRWMENSNDKYRDGDNRYFSFNWTLFHGRDAEPGPASVSYDLTVTNSVGGPLTVGPDGCFAFTDGVAQGHPYSGGDHDPDAIAPFVGSCTLVHNGGSSFTLTLTGIDYTQTTVPTQDSFGSPLPTSTAAVASGQIRVGVTTTANSGQIELAMAPREYESLSGATAQDDPSNNSTSNTWTTGTWSHGYHPFFTGPSLPSWSDTYRVAPGTVVSSGVSVIYQNVNVVADTGGLCQVLDSRFVDFEDAAVRLNGATEGEILDVPIEYYVGAAASVDPDSGAYDPNVFECTGSAGWVSTPPSDLSTVKAVRSVYPMTPQIEQNRVFLQVLQRVGDTVPTGQDIWNWGSYMAYGNTSGDWNNPRRSLDPADVPPAGTLTPDARYPYAGAGRDVLRIVGVIPVISKSAESTRIDPGGEGDYTITYAAEGAGNVAPTVDDFTIVDTLPLGATYLSGSATPEPETSTDGDGRQVLTWILDGVTTNEEHELFYTVVFDDDLASGDRLLNEVSAEADGVASQVAEAAVVVNDSGQTGIIKTADQAFIPNLSGDGEGEGSWTITVVSQDPSAQDFVDVIDILPYNGDGRGTDMSGTYQLSGPVDAPAGANVLYTTADPATLSDDPSDATNGAAGDATGNTAGWSSTFAPDATAFRVITGPLAPSGSFDLVVGVETADMVGGDALVNRAQGRAENTRLTMRTSASTEIANFYSASLKKYVQDSSGAWRDANDALDYPTFAVGDSVAYRVVIENTGQGTLTGVDISDDEYPELGAFTVDSLAPGASETHEYTVALDGAVPDSIINTACAEADVPADSQVPPTINCDPAGILVQGDPQIVKELIDATPNDAGQWDLVYEITVTNASVASTGYTLDDVLRFADQVTVDSAAITASPAGVTLESPAWNGDSAARIATDVPLAGSDDAGYEPHVYEVSVTATVPMEIDGAGTGDDVTECGAPGDGSDRALSNTATITDPSGEESTDEACAPLPSITMAKSVLGSPVPNGDGTWTITYQILVDNDGAGEGVYDLTDRMESAATGFDILDTEVVQAPPGVTVSPTWTGTGAAGAPENEIATGITIAGATQHLYQVEALVELTTTEPGIVVVTPCGELSPGAPSVTNDAEVSHNGNTAEDDACVTVTTVSVVKDIVEGPTPNGDGTWTIRYQISATSAGTNPATYDLTDRLVFGDALEVIDADIVVSPAGVTVEPGWTGRGSAGAAENVVAADASIDGDSQHLYEIEVVASIDEATADPADLQCPPPGEGSAGGFANEATILSNGVTAQDDDCAGVPLLTLEKALTDGPTAAGEGTWTLTYALDVANLGSASGEYDLVDALDYGDGISVQSAAITATPPGVPSPATWTGQGPAPESPENTIALGVSVDAESTHEYEITVVVSLDAGTAQPGALECSGEGGSGLYNSASLTHNGEQQQDDACAGLPLISITKSVEGSVVPVEGQDGVYEVTYALDVANRGSLEGTYDLDDELAPGEGVTVTSIESVTTDAPASVGIEPDFDGAAQPRIVADQPIAAAGAEPTVHRYTVVVRYSADLDGVDVDPEVQGCAAAGGGTVAGGLANAASVSWNDISDEDDACVRPGKPTLDKELIAAVPLGDGQWSVQFSLTVGNVGGEATTYDLDDELLFADRVDVAEVSVTGPEGVALDPGFDGISSTRVASDVSIAGLDDVDYAPHVYVVDVVADVPLVFPPDAVDPDGTGGPTCTARAGDNTLRQGLNNAATLTNETGGTATDTDCAGLPSFTITKEMVGTPVQGTGDDWQVTYDISVANGGADGVYSVSDRLRYGAGITVRDARIESAPSEAAVNAGWTGLGAADDASTVVAADVALEAGGEHVYRIVVDATVDAAAADESTYGCADVPDGSGSGFANVASVGSNGLGATAATCGVPDEPVEEDPPTTGGDLSSTGGVAGAAPWVAAGLIALGAVVLVGSRRGQREV